MTPLAMANRMNSLSACSGFFNFREASAGSDHADYEKQHEQSQADGLKRTVDIDYDAPNTAAFEILRTGRYKLPYLGKFLVPSF